VFINDHRNISPVKERVKPRLSFARAAMRVVERVGSPEAEDDWGRHNRVKVMREAVIIALACFLILIMAVALIIQCAAMTARRFPPPWTVEELDACFVVRD
jgi:hypothetical protein